MCLEYIFTVADADGLVDDRVDHQNVPEARLHPADAAHHQLRAIPEVPEEQLVDFLQVLHRP